MTEKLLTGTLSLNTNKQNLSIFKLYQPGLQHISYSFFFFVFEIRIFLKVHMYAEIKKLEEIKFPEVTFIFIQMPLISLLYNMYCFNFYKFIFGMV